MTRLWSLLLALLLLGLCSGCRTNRRQTAEDLVPPAQTISQLDFL